MATDDQLAQHEINSFFDSYVGYRLTSAAFAVLFVALVLCDGRKAFMRKAHWVPGQVLVLNALSIILLNFLDHLDVSINSKDTLLKEVQLIVLVEAQLATDSRRVMLCVFIAYLLPGMVSGDLKTVWVKLGALVFTVIAHMGFEVYFLLKHNETNISETSHLIDVWNQCKPYRVWLIPSYIAITSAIILLVVLLSCAVIAGESIRNVMSQKVPLALSCCRYSSEDRKCKNIEDHVLKSWIVVRASQPDYIMARSVFSAFAGVVVTVCVLLLLVKSIFVPLPPALPGLIAFSIHCAFVVVGSTVVVFRWLTAVFYFPKDLCCLFYFEDFWTRNLVQRKKDLHGIRSFLSIFLTMFLWVQKLMVLLSKVCWSLSQFVFGMIPRLTMSNDKSELFSKYGEVLENIRMPRENAESLWRANGSAFLNTENNFKKGIKNGKRSCKELMKLLEHKTETLEDDAPTSLEEEKHFMEVAKKSWKLRAVSLIHLIIYFHDGTNSDVVTDCIEAYSQAVCFMDMVDRSDPQAKLVSQAADNEFYTLENSWKKHLKIKLKKPREAKAKKLVEEKIKNPLKENMEQLSREEREGNIESQRNRCMDKLQDSGDWKTVAAKISLYKIWKAMDVNSTNPVNAIYNLRRLLANVFFHCIEKELNKAVIQNCNKWAEDGKEDDIFKAAFTAGKAIGLRQQIKDKDAECVPAEGVEGERCSTVEDQV